MVGGVEHALGAGGELAGLEEGLAALGEMLDQASAPFAQLRLVGRLLRQIGQLAGVFLEMEELLFAVPRQETADSLCQLPSVEIQASGRCVHA